MLHNELHNLIWRVALFLVCSFALWRGGWPERTVAVASLLASPLSAMVQNQLDYGDPQWRVLAVDVVFLGLLVWVALKSDRYWPMWAAAAQLLAIVTHIVMIVDRTVGGWAYLTGGIIFSYLGLLALAVGTSLKVLDARKRQIAG